MRRKAGIIIMVLIVVAVGSLYYFYGEKKDNSEVPKTNYQNLVDKMSNYVLTKKESNLYTKLDNDFKEIGKVSNNTYLEIDKEYAEEEYIKLLHNDYYISLDDLKDTKEQVLNNRYKKYVLWNENIKTNSKTKFYDISDNLVFELEEGMSLPIIIKYDDKHGVEFNNELFFIKDHDEIIESNNTEEVTRDNIRTLTYHSVYDKSKGEVCNNYQICLNIEKFIEQLDYMKEENFLTLTMEEIEMFVDKRIRIPKNSIALTFDDGLTLGNIIPLIEEYEMYTTFFIITSQGDYADYFDYEYARFESHTHDMHQNYKCPIPEAYKSWGQGGLMTCSPVDSIITDLKTSQEKLGGSKYFAYPFFEFYGNGKEGLKEAGFKMAFIGQWQTDGFSTYDTDRYMMRRKTIFDDLTLEGFKKLLE